MNENEKRETDKRVVTDININGPFKIEVTHELGRTWILVAIAIALIVLMYNTCRADTTKVFQAIERPNDTLEVKQSDGTIAVYVWCRVGTRMPMDTVYPYKWPDSVVRARGLDSVYTLPHDTVVCRKWENYITSTNPGYMAHDTTVCRTLKIPGAWWYFDWDKGKRTNLRRKP